MSNAPELDLPARATGRPHVTVVGYYGSAPEMNLENYMAMMRMVEELLVEDWKLDLASIVWVANGGTWCSHLPCSLWRRHAGADAHKGMLVLPFEWSDLKAATGRNATSGLLRSINGSHAEMTRRLREQDRHWMDSKAELERMVSAGCEVLNRSSKAMQLETLLQVTDYLVYMPYSKSDAERNHGANLFEQAECPKRCLPLDKFVKKYVAPH
jgi:hypothetical protein